jgi:MFS family permease
MLCGMAGMAAAMGIGRFAFTPLMPLMQEHFGLTLAQGGWLASANYAGYLAGALLCFSFHPAPRLCFRWGMVAVALFTLAMCFTPSFAVWLGCRFLAGVASAFVFLGVAAWVPSLLSPVQWASRSGWIYGGVGGGIAMAGLVGLVAGVAGLQAETGWLMLGAACSVVVAALWRPLSGAAEQPEVQRPSIPAGSIGSEGRRLVLCYAALGVGYIIPATFLPAVARGWVNDPGVFGWTWPVFGLAAAVSTVAVARLFRNAPARKVWAWSQLVMAAGVLAPVVALNMGTLLVSALCVGGTFMVTTMAGMQEARRVAGGSAPRLMAAMTAAFALGQLVGPLAVRSVSGVGQAIQGPSMVAAAALLLSAAVLFMRSPGTAVAHAACKTRQDKINFEEDLT